MKPSNLKSISCILLLLLLSCNKKFDHSIPAQNTIPASCALCNYADQISGQYRGQAYSQYYYFQDSLTVTMEHIFLNLGPQIDSTTMYFRRIKDYDTKPTQIDTLLINTNNGDFSPVDMKIANDSITILQMYTAPSISVIKLDFKGKKIP
ncbi:hypothetical protein [Fluviicola sp.]|uniref:hypothetical protein n=1 Tax=Fluviicola sp. TaxID=1917219 RepID=UPI00261DE887|nr:hypothetical protein [Fluviicola sp.]